MFHLPNTDRRTAKTFALRIITENANRIMAERSSTREDKENALMALMAIEWTPDLARSVGGRALNRLLCRIRNNVFSDEEYKIFSDMIAHATNEEIPPNHSQWELRRSVIIKFHLYEMSTLREWVSLVARLDSRGLRPPADLARINFSDLEEFERDLPHPDMLLWLWQGARQSLAAVPVTHPRTATGAAPDLQSLILSLRRGDIRDTAVSRDYEQIKADFGLPSNFERLSQAKRLEAFNNAGMSDYDVPRLSNLGALRNTVRAFAGSLRSAASGMQSYLNYCQFNGRIAFPVQTDTVLLWSAMFKPGRTFARYLSHVMKASILMREPTDWMCPAIRSVARGLASAQDLSFKFQNYVFASDLLRLLKFIKLSSELGLAAFLAFLLFLRVPSEALWMRVAPGSENLTEFTPQPFSVLAGIRIIKGSPMLLVKFPWRKNLKRGCILRRPCLCSEASDLARLFCPDHMIWPRVAAGKEDYGLAFPGLSRSNFNRKLKSAMLGAGFSKGGEFPPTAFDVVPRRSFL